MMDSKQIGIVGNLSCYGGVQTCIISLIKGLNSRGIIPYLITNEEVNQRILTEQKLELRVHKINYSWTIEQYNNRSYLRGFRELFYYYRTSWLEKAFDFIYVFVPGVINDAQLPNLYYVSMTARLPKSLNPGFQYRLKLMVYSIFSRFIAPVYDIFQSNQYVINSSYTANLFEEVYGRKISVVFPPVSIDSSSSMVKKEFNSRPKNIVFFSRIIPEKRPELFLQLARKHPELNFKLVGGYDSNDYVNGLKQLVLDWNLNNVQWFTDVERIEMESVLETSDIYVFTAKNEHFGITTVEAIFKGLIPFVHNSGGQREIVPIEELRFDDDDFFSKFGYLVSDLNPNRDHYLNEISIHAKKFEERHFQKSLLDYLP